MIILCNIYAARLFTMKANSVVCMYMCWLSIQLQYLKDCTGKIELLGAVVSAKSCIRDRPRESPEVTQGIIVVIS